jgi:RNA polymerase sigma factor (sigma-70 family)
MSDNATENVEELLGLLSIHIYGAVRYACRVYQIDISRDEIEDLCQEVIIVLIEHNHHCMNTFDERKSSAKTWIYTITKRYVGRRMRGGRAEMSLEEILPESLSCSPEQESTLLSKERWDVIRAAVAQLPKSWQELFWVSIEGLSDSQISQLLRIKATEVRKRRYKLRKRLRKLALW